MRVVLVACSSLALAVAACGGTAAPSRSPAAAAAAQTAPTPYTAEQIRAGCPAGRTIEVRIAEEGKPPVVQQITFLPSTEDEVASIQITLRDEASGTVVSENRSTSRWD